MCFSPNCAKQKREEVCALVVEMERGVSFGEVLEQTSVYLVREERCFIWRRDVPVEQCLL